MAALDYNLGVDANGYVWRFYADGRIRAAPTNSGATPIVKPVNYFFQQSPPVEVEAARDAETGRFVSLAYALAHPKRTVTERINRKAKP